MTFNLWQNVNLSCLNELMAAATVVSSAKRDSVLERVEPEI